MQSAGHGGDEGRWEDSGRTVKDMGCIMSLVVPAAQRDEHAGRQDRAASSLQCRLAPLGELVVERAVGAAGSDRQPGGLSNGGQGLRPGAYSCSRVLDRDCSCRP